MLFSGFVKAVDPMGMAHKLSAYFAAWGFSVGSADLLPQVLGLALATLEVALGIYLLLGIRRKLTTRAVFAFMAAMTALTLYIYIANPVTDCGCFGSALELSNGATLLKNIVLLLCAAVLLWREKYLFRLITARNEWITSIYAIAYTILLGLYALHFLPPIDFTAYRVGIDMRSAVLQGLGERRDVRDLGAFFLLDAATGGDVTEAVLGDTGAVFLVTLPALEEADAGCNDRINDLSDACRERGYKLYGVVDVAADSLALTLWNDQTGATYPYLQTDPQTLQAMTRANPGLLLLRDGRVAGKWSNNELPDIEAMRTLPPAPPQPPARGRQAMPVLLWFFVPLALTIAIDRLWIGSKFYKHHQYIKRLFKLNTTMRKKIVAGNWKMNLNLQEGVALAKELNAQLAADKPACDVVICTPFIHLASVAGELTSGVIGLGAENCADKAAGAYTGEVSAAMVKSTGADYVILGHSERRAYYGETAEILKEKINLALANGLKVIFCIGEVLEERESGKQNEVVKAQLEGSLFDLSQAEFANIILAYEPVWAIGTGKTATAEQAQEMHAHIRAVIAGKFGAEAAENVSILYGGSCKPSNAREIFAKPDVDGGLIGGAALKAADFKGIIDAWK